MQNFTDSEFVALAESLTKEGVTAEDISYWRNLSDAEKEAIKETDATFRITFLSLLEDKGMPKKEAYLRLMQAYSFYEEYPPRKEVINITYNIGLSENDIALPYELHSRIDKFFIKLFADKIQMEYFQKELKQFSSCNALLRHKIKMGEI